MRVLVCGGRDYKDRQRVFDELLILTTDEPISRIIHGACGWDADVKKTQSPDQLRGADRWADEFANEYGIPVKRFPARWQLLKKRAGGIRNQQMLDEGLPDLVVAFPGGYGTMDTVRRAHDAGIPRLMF